METRNDLDLLCSKVKTIVQGVHAALLKDFIDLLYDREMDDQAPEYFSPEDLAAIEAGKAQIARGECVSLEELKKELGL